MLPSSLRFTRLSLALIATLAALAATAGSAQAAAPCPPGEDYTAGNKLCLKTTHEPGGDFVIPGGYIRYRVDILNPGTATATKATLKFTLDPQTTLESFPEGCTRTDANVSPTVVTCFIGSIKPNPDPTTRSFLVKAPGSETSTSAVASISADARQRDKQENPNDPTEEDFADEPEVVTIDFVQGLSASFVPANTPLTLDTDSDRTGATSEDKRTAKFILLASGFSTSATVDDEVDDDTFVCPEGLKCPGGGWTEAFIPGPNGLDDPFSLPSRMELWLRYDSSTLNGVTPGQYVMLHDDDYDPSTIDYEEISKLCGPNPKPPCLLGRPDSLSDGDLLVKALVTGNWRFR